MATGGGGTGMCSSGGQKQKPLWREELERSIEKEKGKPASRFMTLATVKAGEPRARTVVFRGFMDDDDGGDVKLDGVLKIITDVRSEKMQEIKDNPKAEIMWYFLDTREQYRIRGTLDVITDKDSSEARQKWRSQQWEEISPGMKQSYEWPSPGQARTEENDDDKKDYLDPKPSVDVSPNFALIMMVPERVDVLKLRESPQKRHVHSKNGDGWTVQRINA